MILSKELIEPKMQSKNLLSCFIIISTCLFTTQFAIAQNIGDKYPKDKELIKEGNQLYDEKKYNEAITKYAAVNQNDSFYVDALYELINTYQTDKKFDKAAEYALKALKLNKTPRGEFLLQYANALEELNQFDSAISTYNLGLKEFPYNNRFAYEKGLSYAKKNKWEEALIAYTESAKSNLFHGATHYRIGMMAADANQPALALLALQTNIFLNSNQNSVINTIDKMEKIASHEYVTENEVSEQLFKDANLSEINEIILSKAAMTNKYKAKVDLNYWIIKQIQVTLEKLPANYESNNWLFNFYVKFYKELWKQNHFEGAILLGFQNLSTKEIAKEVKSNTAKIDAFRSWAINYFTNIRNEKTLVINGKEEKTKYWYTGLSLTAIGDEKATGENIGYWQYFTNGYKTAEGNFENGNKIGEWKYYYTNGKLKGREFYNKQYKSDGEYLEYYENGELAERSYFKDGLLEGEAITYNVNGTIKSKMTFKNGKVNGMRYNYSSTGILSNAGNLVDGVYNGEYQTYHVNGKVNLDCKTVNNNIEGVAKYYHNNGVLQSEGTFTNDKRTGVWKWFDENGKIETEGLYANNERTGTWKYYHPNGQLKEEMVFDNGKRKGLNKSWTEEGKLFEEIVFKNDKIDSYKYYDVSGKVLAQGKTQGGKLTFAMYNQYGQKIKEGLLVNGIEEGIWKFYYPNGQLEYELPYEKGVINGVRKNYFKNGEIKYELNFVNGNRDGYYKGYHINRNVQVEGYYENDEQHGAWKFYYANGNLSGQEFFQVGTLVGISEDYDKHGRYVANFDYTLGTFNNVYQLDSNGKIYHASKLRNGNGYYELKTDNGKTYYKAKYIGGEKDSLVTTYFGNGKMRVLESFKMGKRDGFYKSFNEKGILTSMGLYKNDEQDSVWNHYFDDGKILKINHFKNGKLDGPSFVFYENGKKEVERSYKDGERHGDYIYYDFNGAVILKIKYVNGVFQSYSYLGKDGKLVPEIALPNESGEVLTYHPNGNKAVKFTIKNGLINGLYTIHMADGKPYSETEFVNGNYEGVDKTYYPGGNIKSIERYFKDELNGKCEYFDTNGKLIRETHYLLGSKDGWELVYDTTGKVTKRILYKSDVIYE